MCRWFTEVLEGAKTAPVAFPGDAPAPARPRGVLDADRHCRVVGGARVLGEVDLVALRRNGEVKTVGSCGLYSGRSAAAEVFRKSYPVDMEVFDRRTGARVARTTFAPKLGPCPRSTVTFGGGEASATFGPDEAAIAAWLGTLVR